MNNSKKNRPQILKKGIEEAVLQKKHSEGNLHDADSKQMSAEEVAAIFEQDEIELLRKEYECLNMTPEEIEKKINEEVIGQEEAISQLVFVCWFNQFVNFAEDCGYDVPKVINIILIGPTGCGKTSSVKALRKYLKVPVSIYSSDSITCAGYIGNKVEDILVRHFEESGRNLPLAERGIIYVDEIDKKVEQISSAGKDVNGKSVQEELLKVLEDGVIDIVLPDKTKVHFSTRRLTVIVGGAFVGLEKIREKRLRGRNLGFKDASERLKEDERDNENYIPDDIIKFGFIPEFVGRIKVIDEFRKLEEADMLRIILQGKESPYIKLTRFLADVLNVDQQISLKYLQKISKELANSSTGARELERIIIEMFRPILKNTFQNIGKYGICEIDEDGHYSLEFDDVIYYG